MRSENRPRRSGGRRPLRGRPPAWAGATCGTHSRAKPRECGPLIEVNLRLPRAIFASAPSAHGFAEDLGVKRGHSTGLMVDLAGDFSWGLVDLAGGIVSGLVDLAGDFCKAFLRIEGCVLGLRETILHFL